MHLFSVGLRGSGGSVATINALFYNSAVSLAGTTTPHNGGAMGIKHEKSEERSTAIKGAREGRKRTLLLVSLSFFDILVDPLR